MLRYIALILSFFTTLSFDLVTVGKSEAVGVNRYETYQTIESFGTSSAWWAQTIDDEATARRIARLLYDPETGLGLTTYRYNIGGGSADDPAERIDSASRKTESFLVFDPDSGESRYDFTRDANAVRMMKLAVEYGAKNVVLFCNSPHYSMTVSGHASGGLEANVSNLPKENYQAFVDYVLTIADHFLAEGIPVTEISPINEPQWSWGGDWVGQEGCHYTAEECAELLELFAVTMSSRGCPYKLACPESGQLTEEYDAYIDEAFSREAVSSAADHIHAHSYWMDRNVEGKAAFAAKMAEKYPDKKFVMSEWCELPLRLDSTTIDSGIYMAKTMIEDLNVLNAVSWQSWTAVNGDGLMELDGETLTMYKRYYAFRQFSAFITPGMTRCDALVSSPLLQSTAFLDDEKTVIVLVNDSETAVNARLLGCYRTQQTYITDAASDCALIYSGAKSSRINVPGMSIMTLVLGK
ncbi:MAG: hypothetical protein K6C36_02440 [Clostridia bacterium]|nr:hypothetical protein [Clostridia bacterium]